MYLFYNSVPLIYYYIKHSEKDLLFFCFSIYLTEFFFFFFFSLASTLLDVRVREFVFFRLAVLLVDDVIVVGEVVVVVVVTSNMIVFFSQLLFLPFLLF